MKDRVAIVLPASEFQKEHGMKTLTLYFTKEQIRALRKALK